MESSRAVPAFLLLRQSWPQRKRHRVKRSPQRNRHRARRRRKTVIAYMTIASKPDPPTSPDGAPPPDNLPRTFGGQACLDIVTAGVKAMVTAGRTETFQEFVGSLGSAEREVLCESYLHFLMAEQAWNSQVPGFTQGEKGVGIVVESSCW